MKKYNVLGSCVENMSFVFRSLCQFDQTVTESTLPKMHKQGKTSSYKSDCQKTNSILQSIFIGDDIVKDLQNVHAEEESPLRSYVYSKKYKWPKWPSSSHQAELATASTGFQTYATHLCPLKSV